MSDFCMLKEDTHCLFEDFDGTDSVLEGESPIDGLFDDLNFDWDNDALEIALGDSGSDLGQYSNQLDDHMFANSYCSSPKHVSQFHQPRFTPVTPSLEQRAASDPFPCPPSCKPRDTFFVVEEKLSEDVTVSQFIKSRAPTPLGAIPETKRYAGSDTENLDEKVNGEHVAKTPALVPFPDAVVSKNSLLSIQDPEVVFHTGTSHESPEQAAKMEAKRRRAVRKEILLSQRKGKAAASSPVLMHNEDAVAQVTEIAHMLLSDASSTTVKISQMINSPLSTVAHSSIIENLEIKDATNRTSPKTKPVNSSESNTLKATAITSNAKKTKSTSPKGKYEKKRQESSKTELALDDESLCPEFHGSSDVPEHLADLPTGTDPESRRQRRLIRNRLSAALHRKRKRETIDSQKKTIDEKDNEIARLQSELDKVSSKYNALQSSYDTIVRHFGESLISKILKLSDFGKSSFGKSSDSPPHLVNLSASDNSVASSDDERTVDTNIVESPRSSPLHTPSSMEEDETSTEENPDNNTTQSTKIGMPVISGANHIRASKRKRPVGVLPAMATMAMCAVLGCVMLPPSVFKALDPDGSGLQAANVIISSDAGNDARRRLDESISADEMSAMAKWSELGLARLIHDPPKPSGHDQDRVPPSSFVISPIESRPNLWRIDAARNSPWTVERSITLFDFRSILSKQGGTSIKNSPLIPYRFSAPLRPDKLPTTVRDKTALIRRSNLRGSKVSVPEGDENLDTESSFVAQDSLRDERVTGIDVLRDNTYVDNGLKFGPNFMFCPSAYASLAPGFLQLAGLSEDAQDRDEVFAAWGWAKESGVGSAVISDTHKTKEETKAEMIVDFDVDDMDDEEDLFEDAAEEEMDKALVPKFDFVKPGNTFPFVPRGDNSVPLIKNVFTGNDPYMSILVPASILATDLNFLNDDTNINGKEPWIELSCHILSAKLVDGVQFVGDSYSSLH